MAATLLVIWCWGRTCEPQRYRVESLLGCHLAAQMIIAMAPKDGRKVARWGCAAGERGA